MAARQFDLDIVQMGGGDPVHAGDQQEQTQLPLSLVYNIQEELAHFLGVPWMMLEDWLVFGPENGNRIDLLFEFDAGSVTVRCDVRQEAPQFLTLVCDLTRFHGCRFFSPLRDEHIEPDLELVLDAIRKSQLQQWRDDFFYL